MSIRGIKKTATHVGTFEVGKRGEAGEEEVTDRLRSMSMVLNKDVPEDGYIEQKEVLSEDLRERLFFKQQLGHGSFGTAYRAHLKDEIGHFGRDLVVKIPNIYFQTRMVSFVYPDFSLPSLMEWNYVPRLHYGALKEGRGNLKEEYENALLILAPYYHTNDPVRNKLDRHYNLKRMSGSEFNELKREALAIRSHPGYVHIHKIIHFDSEIGFIFSEQCDGDLHSINWAVASKGSHELIFPGMNTEQFNDKVLMDMTNAVDYLLNVVHVAQLDFKPGNILYKVTKSFNSAHVIKIDFVVSDFGICVPFGVNGRTLKSEQPGGTYRYLPHDFYEGVMRTGRRDMYYQADKLMLWAFGASMLETFISPSRKLFGAERLCETIDDFFKKIFLSRPTLSVEDSNLCSYIKHRYEILYDMIYIGVTDTDYVNEGNTCINDRFLDLVDHLNTPQLLTTSTYGTAPLHHDLISQI